MIVPVGCMNLPTFSVNHNKARTFLQPRLGHLFRKAVLLQGSNCYCVVHFMVLNECDEALLLICTHRVRADAATAAVLGLSIHSDITVCTIHDDPNHRKKKPCILAGL